MRRLFLFPEQGKEALDLLLVEIAAARNRVIGVSFLPPDRLVGDALNRARVRLGDRVQLILDGTTQTSVGRSALPWADVRVLETGGTIHAKFIVADEAVWWGSWNFSRSAIRQADAVELISDKDTVSRFVAWAEEIRSLSRPLDPTEAARGPYKGAPEQTEIRVKDPILGW
jgi:phosphatidylserine/phosphatidylglycerophosphate/cardiolipin synthase-like enzyme